MQASIAERIVYGRPYDPVRDIRAVPVVGRPTAALVGRILMSAIFISAGIEKLMGPSGTISYMQKAGVPSAGALVYVAAAAEILGGLSLLLGFLSRVGAIGLVVYTAIISLVMHNFWAAPADQVQAQMVNFMKNVAIIGGLFMVIAMGPGRFSLDYAMRKPRAV